MEVMVKVLNILSIATKEIEQSRTSESFLRDMFIDYPLALAIYSERYLNKLAGRNNIENALGELENLIQG